MAHAAAPFRARDEDILAAAEIVDIADAATRLEHLHGLAERALGIAARDDHAVHAAAVRLFHDLRNDIALAVVQDLRCAVAPRRLRADRTRADCKQLCRTVQGRARNGHQADGADADDADIIAELHIGQLHAVEARRDHVRQHDGCDRIDIRRENDEIYLKVMDYKSGRKEFSLDDVYYGLSMQLPVYMNAAVSFLQERYPQTTIIPAAMLYYRLQKPIIEIEGTKAEEEIEAEIRKQMKPDGLLLGEDCVLTMLDQGFTTDSDVMRVGRKKDGSFKAASQVISQEDLGLLLSYTQKKAEQMMQQMAEGEIAVTPLKTGNHTSCDFCEYREVCRMDERIDGYRLQELTSLTDEERKEAMERAVYGGSEEGHRDEK